MTAPRRSAGARHCKSALSGTKSNPLKMPRKVMSVIVPYRPGPINAKASALRVRPSAPSGSNPYSTFDADSLPASMQPRPTPIPRAAKGNPLCVSESPRCVASYARITGGTSVAIVHTKTCPISARRSTRSALIDSQARRIVVSSPPSVRAALTGGIVNDPSKPKAERTASITPPIHGRPWT